MRSLGKVNEVVKYDASQLAQDYYTDYAKYVLETRALPSVYDGLKLVQRRIIYQASKQPDKMMKIANLAGHVMFLHPHGDSSGAIVGLGSPVNNLPMFDTQGNWGSANYPAASSRYIEGKLSKIARFIYCQFLDYADMIDGEIGHKEPDYLPCLLPLALVNGSQGIGVGLSTNIMPLNYMDLIDYYIKCIKNDGPVDGTCPRPDLGAVVINLSDEDTELSVKSHTGWVRGTSIITQESSNVFVVTSLCKSIDQVLKKLGKYINYDLVDYRNESSSHERYVFEVVDSSVDIAKFRRDLENATTKSNTFRRLMVDHDTAVYSSLDYVVSKSLWGLNRAIDKKNEYEKSKYTYSIELLKSLAKAKELGLFEGLGKVSKDELIGRLVANDIREEVAKDIVSKPISYLTNSHDGEIEWYLSKVSEIENHNRKEYLVSLYLELKDMLTDYYESRPHSILESQVLTNPKVRLINPHEYEIGSFRRGVKFTDSVYLIGKDGGLYKRAISSVAKSVMSTNTEEDIVAIVTDNCRYIEIQTNDGKGVAFDTQSYKYDKKVVNLYEGQSVRTAQGWSEESCPDNVKSIVRSKISRAYSY